MKIVVIGGGAAGFFAGLRAKEVSPKASVMILEKGLQFLAKVKISGGGRCNVTHNCHELSKLLQYYPRGAKFLREPLQQFMPKDMIAWLQTRGVTVKAEEDGRMFPDTDDSQTIIDCFLQEAQRLGVQTRLKIGVQKIEILPTGNFRLQTNLPTSIEADRLIVATGGSPKLSGLAWLEELGLEVNPPVPSLFTFNLPKNPITELLGISTEAKVRIVGTKLEQQGALLITHWGLSGPVILKLSAWGARELASMNYEYQVAVSWLPAYKEDDLRAYLLDQKANNKKQVGNTSFELPKRLWHFLVGKANISPESHWQDLKKQEINKLASILCYDVYDAKGKTTYKEEFVTSGGVMLSEVNPKTMESKKIPHLYLAGEVLDIDGVTGGFNFQSAWATGYAAGSYAPL
jgi:predicted Rossmann fold flavoprotein